MDDKRDRWTPMIEASHPLEVGTKDAHDAYATAMEMVGNRHSKGALVDLVCWLVQRVDAAEQQLRTSGVPVVREYWNDTPEAKAARVAVGIEKPARGVRVDALYDAETPPVGIFALRDAVRCLRDTGRFVDEEGEATNALSDLLDRLTDRVETVDGGHRNG
jgi:hypothetical protein